MKKKVGLIIQGPITTINKKNNKHYNANQNIKKILENYQHIISEIILVTWKNERKKICKEIIKNKNLKILFLNDPGVPKLFSKDISDNRLRQFYSCYYGIKAFSDEIEVVIKTRTDLYIDLKKSVNFFLAEQKRKKKFLNSKFEGVICSKRFYLTMPYWLSDFFYIGNRDLLKKFFYSQIKYKNQRFGSVTIGVPEIDSVLKFLYFNRKKIKNFSEDKYFPNLPKKLDGSKSVFYENEFYLWQYSLRQYFSVLPYKIVKSAIFKGEKYYKYHKYFIHDSKQFISGEKNYINLLKKISHKLNSFLILKHNSNLINFNYFKRKLENKLKKDTFSIFFIYFIKFNSYYKKLLFYFLKK
jgi:hypothetical protein